MKQANAERVHKAQTCKAFISPIIIETKQLELDMSISMSFLNIYTKLLAT